MEGEESGDNQQEDDRHNEVLQAVMESAVIVRLPRSRPARFQYCVAGGHWGPGTYMSKIAAANAILTEHGERWREALGIL